MPDFGAAEQVQAQPQPGAAPGAGEQEAEALAQQIMQATEQLKGMVPAEVFAGFMQQLSTGPQEPEQPAPGAAPVEGGIAGAPRV